MAETPKKDSGPWFNNTTYNFVKFVAQILLPALGTLYAAVAALWGLPATEQVVGTVMAVDTFLGVVLGISSAQYNSVRAQNGELEDVYDGVMEVIQHTAESGSIQLHLDTHPSELVNRNVVRFKKVDSTVPTDESSQAEVAATPGDLPPVAPPS